MIEKIELTKFKRFSHISIDVHAHTISFIVGGNNSGKSSILHALAVWEFCKTVLIFEKGDASIRVGYRGAGIGIAFDDFTPINIPSFKYIWTNLNAGGGYTLSIKCYWKDNGGASKYLAVALSLVQERLYIKCSETNLNAGDIVPRIAYLPTFAGIGQKEQSYAKAMRNRLIGQGLAGAVLRNEIIDMQEANLRLRKELKGDAEQLSRANLKNIRSNDPFELLQQVVYRRFNGLLYPLPFNKDFHTHVGVDFKKGEMVGTRFKPFKGYNKRDIMVEGSGFLQWLSVYTFALSPNVDVLLLDEPDAHLHVSLQTELVKELQAISKKFNKQILLATHSVEIIKEASAKDVMYVKSPSSVKYLKEESSKSIVLTGLGCEYFPLLEKIQSYKRILFVENESDATFLQLMTSDYMEWPQNLVIWGNANHHTERKHVFDYLKKEISDGLKCISLNDKDFFDYANTQPDLRQGGYPDDIVPEHNLEMRYRLLRRSEMENYLLHPTAIARTIVKKHGGDVISIEQEIKDFILSEHSITFPPNFTQTNRTNPMRPLFETPGKDVVNSVCDKYNIGKFDIAKEMHEDEVFEDIKTLCSEIVNMCM